MEGAVALTATPILVDDGLCLRGYRAPACTTIPEK